MNGSRRRSPQNTRRPAIRSFRPAVEQLEDRSLLSGFASIQGEISTPVETDVFPIRIDPANLSLHRWGTYVGFEVQAAGGSQLDPSPARIRALVRPVSTVAWKSAEGPHSSVTLATVRAGTFQLIVGGDRRTTGTYKVDIFLVGDANGDYRVDKRDVQLIHNLRGTRLGQASYVRDADANRDGVINAVDEGLARTNLKTATHIRPLNVTLGVDPDADPDGDGAVQTPDITLVGYTGQWTKLRLDQGADGSFDQQTATSLGGRFLFNTSIQEGLTPFRVEATDLFGQRATAELDVTLSILQNPLQPTVNLNDGQVATLPGALQTLTWDLGAGAANFDVVVRATAPGTVFSPTGSHAVSSGSLPATGKSYYLRSDNTWGDAEAVFASEQATGNVSVQFPNDSEGEWRLDVVVRDRATGQFVSVAGQDVLVSAIPAVLLKLNRTLANSGDAIQAQLLTSAGSEPKTVRLSATLSLPDGSQVNLPNFGNRLEYLHEGVSTNALYKLLDEPLNLYGEGHYHLRARLLDGQTNHILGMADADVTVSDTPGTLSGVVRDESGQPVVGTSAIVTNVQAFDPDDGFITAHAPIDAQGGYHLTLDPGRYIVSAFVLDAQGTSHRTSNATVTVVGPDSPNAQLDLTVAGAVSSLNSAASSATFTRAGEGENTGPCGGLPRRTVQVEESFLGDLNSERADLLDLFKANLLSQTTATCIDLITNSEARDSFQALRDSQAAGSPEDVQNAFSSGTSRAVAGELLLRLEVKRRPTLQAVSGSLLNISIKPVQDLAGTFKHASGITPAALRQLVIEAAQQLAAGLPQSPTANRDLPRVPTLRLSLSEPIVVLGPASFVTATVTLTDTTVNGPPEENKAIRLEVRDPSWKADDKCPGPLCRVFSGTTDSSGKFTSSFHAGNTDGIYRVKAIFTRANGEKFNRESNYEVITSAHLQLISPQLNLGAGQFTKVKLTLTRPDGTPAPGALVDLAATFGTLSTIQVTTDKDGIAELIFTAGSSNGEAEITALYSPQPSPGQPPEQITSLLKLNVTGAVGMNFNVLRGGAGEGEAGDEPPVVLPGGIASLFADLLVGDDRVAALPVQFTLQGAGALVTINSQTDTFGRAETIYVAPSSGSGTSTITATATVDGQTYTRSVDVRFEPVPVSVTVSPTTASLNAGQSKQFTADVAGLVNQAVTWTATGGTITSSGLFTAGSTTGSYKVTATSVADPTKTGQASVEIQSSPNTLTGTYVGTWTNNLGAGIYNGVPFPARLFISDPSASPNSVALFDMSVADINGIYFRYPRAYIGPHDTSGNSFKAIINDGSGGSDQYYAGGLSGNTLTGTLHLPAPDPSDTSNPPQYIDTVVATFTLQRE